MGKHVREDLVTLRPGAGGEDSGDPGGQYGQLIWSSREDPGALPDLELRHVLRNLMLTLEGGVRYPDVSTHGDHDALSNLDHPPGKK